MFHCGCCVGANQYIEQHLDPSGTIRRAILRGEKLSAREIVRDMNRVFRSDGGSGVSVKEMSRYLTAIR